MNRLLTHSQNSINNLRVIETLLDKTDITSDDIVYEIGPGRGAITGALAKRCKHLVAVELDKNLFRELQWRASHWVNVKIIFGDFLKVDTPRHSKYKIFSNIPFNTTADIIHRITEGSNPPVDSYLIVQKESAIKFAGTPFGRETQASLLLKPFFELKIVSRLKRHDFSPIPRVDSVLLRIRKREAAMVTLSNAQLYRDFVVYGFNQWKDTLEQALENVLTSSQFGRLSRDLRFKRMASPTDLEFNHWFGLFTYFMNGVSREKQILISGAERRLKRQQQKIKKRHRTNAASHRTGRESYSFSRFRKRSYHVRT
jgi:23S rRNA (adenine-N6)-dimethyltransferase